MSLSIAAWVDGFPYYTPTVPDSDRATQTPGGDGA